MLNTIFINILLTDSNFINYLIYFTNYLILIIALIIPIYGVIKFLHNVRLWKEFKFNGDLIGFLIFIIPASIIITFPQLF